MLGIFGLFLVVVLAQPGSPSVVFGGGAEQMMGCLERSDCGPKCRTKNHECIENQCRCSGRKNVNLNEHFHLNKTQIRHYPRKKSPSKNKAA